MREQDRRCPYCGEQMIPRPITGQLLCIKSNCWWSYNGYSIPLGVWEKRPVAQNADLIAAAGTAATALAEAGYDAVEVFRALPEILRDFVGFTKACSKIGIDCDGFDDLLRRIRGE